MTKRFSRPVVAAIDESRILVPVRSERLRDAVEQAYAKKYPTPGSLEYVRGFRTSRRRDTTIEFLPRRTSERRSRDRGAAERETGKEEQR